MSVFMAPLYLIGYRLSRRAAYRVHSALASNEGTMPRLPGGKHGHERSHQKYRPDAGEPALWRQDPFRQRVPRAGGAGSAAACTAAPRGSGAPRANRNGRKHGLFTGDAIERRRIQALLWEARKPSPARVGMPGLGPSGFYPSRKSTRNPSPGSLGPTCRPWRHYAETPTAPSILQFGAR